MMSRYERSNDKYNRAMVKRLLAADKAPPEASFDNVDNMMKWLEENDKPPISGRKKSQLGDDH